MIYKGMRTGVSGQIISLIGYFVLIYVTVGFYIFFSEAIFGFIFQNWARPLSFLILLVSIFFIIKILERLLTPFAAEELSKIEKIGGAIFSGVRACLLYGLIGMFLVMLPVQSIRLAAGKDSKTCMTFIGMDASIYSMLSSIIGKTYHKSRAVVLNELLTEIPVPQESDGAPKLNAFEELLKTTMNRSQQANK